MTRTTSFTSTRMTSAGRSGLSGTGRSGSIIKDVWLKDFGNVGNTAGLGEVTKFG